MKFKRRKNWKQGRSILEERSRGGQIIWKGEAPEGEGDVFLVRLRKGAARQLVGTKHDAEAELRRLELEMETDTFRPGKTIRLDTFLEKHYLAAKRRALKPSAFGECARTVTERISPALGRHQVQALAPEHVQAWVVSLWKAELSDAGVPVDFDEIRAFAGRRLPALFARDSTSRGPAITATVALAERVEEADPPSNGFEWRSNPYWSTAILDGVVPPLMATLAHLNVFIPGSREVLRQSGQSYRHRVRGVTDSKAELVVRGWPPEKPAIHLHVGMRERRRRGRRAFRGRGRARQAGHDPCRRRRAGDGPSGMVHRREGGSAHVTE